MARLLGKGLILNERAEAEFLDQSFASVESEFLTVRRATALALRKFAEQSEPNRKKLHKQLSPYLKSENPDVRLWAENVLPVF